MNIRHLAIAALSSITLLAQTAVAASSASDTRIIERGNYMARISGCNDCHTPGYIQADGKVPIDQWLTGSAVGFQGPRGTTYPTNLRLAMSGMSEAEWLTRARQPMRPPMPWFNLSAMSNPDLIALYRFVRSLGQAGEPSPVAVGPGEQVATAYIEFVPKNLPVPAKHAQR